MILKEHNTQKTNYDKICRELSRYNRSMKLPYSKLLKIMSSFAKLNVKIAQNSDKILGVD